MRGRGQLFFIEVVGGDGESAGVVEQVVEHAEVFLQQDDVGWVLGDVARF